MPIGYELQVLKQEKYIYNTIPQAAINFQRATKSHGHG